MTALTDTYVDALREALHPYVERARWFGGKGRDFEIGAVHALGALPGEDPLVRILLAEVRYSDATEHGPTEHGTGGQGDLYQVPLACYHEWVERLAHAFVGTLEDPELGRVHAYDALHDREAMARWLSAFIEAGDSGTQVRGALTFHRLPGHELDPTTHSTLFSGEQSNSSVRFGEDAMMKVFRKVTPGTNPDVEIHEALSRAGSAHIATLYGWVSAPAPGTDDDVMDLAMLQEFLRTASDGWDLAQASVRNLFAEADLHADEVGGDFEAEAARLGEAVAEVHHALRALGERTSDTGQIADLMTSRLRAALPVAPGLAEHEERLLGIYQQLADLGEQRLQRIHGDLHLGQTLRTTQGWKVVDFEGEPAKPLADRLLPDSRWRDVAGMLRSFDYAAHVVERTMAEGDPDAARQLAYRATEWADRNRGAFLTAYAGQELSSGEQALLAAYVADKAVYETVYETRNRPTWVDIPLTAIARIGAS